MRVFDEPQQQSESAPLIEAYELADEPKPSLEVVVGLIRKGEISGERLAKFWTVPSLDQFNDELTDWKMRTGWSHGVRSMVAVPATHTPLLRFCREHVTWDKGRDVGLFDNSSPPRFSSSTQLKLAAGDLLTAEIGSVWSAPPADIKAWLHSRFGIFTR